MGGSLFLDVAVETCSKSESLRKNDPRRDPQLVVSCKRPGETGHLTRFFFKKKFQDNSEHDCFRNHGEKTVRDFDEKSFENLSIGRSKNCTIFKMFGTYRVRVRLVVVSCTEFQVEKPKIMNLNI